MYEVGVARTFHAAHQLEESPTGGDHHEHDYRVEAIVRGGELQANGMLLNLDALGAAADECLKELESTELESAVDVVMGGKKIDFQSNDGRLDFPLGH